MRLRLIAAFLLCGLVLQGAIARIAFESAHGGGTATTAAITTTGASLLVAVVSDTGATTPTTVTLTDSKSNTWVKLATYGDSYARITIFYAYASLSVGASHTVTATGSDGGHNITFTFAAYSGTLTTGDPADQNNGARVGWGGPYQAGSITPTEDGSLIVFGIQPSTSTITVTAVSDSFTVVDQEQAAGFLSSAYADLVQTTAAAINPSATLSAHDAASLTIASFLPEAAAPPAATRRKSMVVFQ